MPPLKSPELYAVAHQVLDPRLSEFGFRRTPKAKVASWTRPEGDKWLTLWFQPWPRNYPLFGCYRFTVEVLLGSEPIVRGFGYELRLPSLLTEAALAALLQLENYAISKLPPPDMTFADSFDPYSREFLLSEWKPRTAPYDPREEVWFRHGDEEDVRLLMEFIIAELPGVLDRFLEWAALYGDHARTLRDAD
jgi:hypothetical protein